MPTRLTCLARPESLLGRQVSYAFLAADTRSARCKELTAAVGPVEREAQRERGEEEGWSRGCGTLGVGGGRRRFAVPGQDALVVREGLGADEDELVWGSGGWTQGLR